MFCCTRFAIAHPGIYIYIRRSMSHTLGLPSIDDFLFHHRANRLTPPWPVSKGVCAGKKHGPTPNRQRGIDAARSSFSPSKEPSTQIKELLEELKLTWLRSVRSLEDRPTSQLCCVGAISSPSNLTTTPSSRLQIPKF